MNLKSNLKEFREKYPIDALINKPQTKINRPNA